MQRSRLISIILTISVFVWITATCQPVNTPDQVVPSRTMVEGTSTQKTSITQNTPTIAPIRPGHLQVDPQKLKGLKIKIWHPFGSQEEPVVNDMIVRFNNENQWGIFANVESPGSSSLLFQQLEKKNNDSDLPNVIAAPIQQLQMWQEDKNSIINLNDYIHDPDWGLTKAETADIPLGFLKQDQVLNRQLGIPTQRVSQVIFYNQTWAEELGFKSSPASATDFEKLACAAAQANLKDADKENDGTGGWIVNTDAETMLAWMTVFGLQNPGDFGRNGYVFNNQNFRDAFSFFKTLYDRGCAWSGRIPTPYDYFATRNALFYSGTLEDIIPQTTAMQHYNNSDQWIILPYPSVGQKPTILTSGYSYAIIVGTPEQQLASWLLIKWLINPENQASLTRAGGAWPASVTAIENLGDFREKYPQWAQSLAWIPISQPAPGSVTWITVRNIFSDAAWQIFQTNTKPESVTEILKQLDATIQEVLTH